MLVPWRVFLGWSWGVGYMGEDPPPLIERRPPPRGRRPWMPPCPLMSWPWSLKMSGGQHREKKKHLKLLGGWAPNLRWWQLQIFFGIFTSKFGEMIQFDEYFSDGLVQPPTRGKKPPETTPPEDEHKRA